MAISQERKCYALAACSAFCALCNAILLIVVPITITGMKRDTEAMLVNLMHIDNTYETTVKGPLMAEGTSERKQYLDWKRTPEELKRDCMKDDDLGESECKPYLHYVLSVFNVTNMDDVVSNVAKPRVEQVGPIYMKIERRVFPLSTTEATWDADGIANFMERYNFTVDEENCDQACMDLLDAPVIVPNPYWSFLLGQSMEPLLLYTFVIGGLQAAGPATFDLAGTQLGLDQGSESVAFADAFLRAAPEALMYNLGVFLATAASAAASASPVCMLGSFPLVAAKCSALQSGLSTMLTSVVWPGMQAMYANNYGSAASMPVFIRATVRQVLGYEAGIPDPLFSSLVTQLGLPLLNFNAAVNREMQAPPHQMASRFGVEGVEFVKDYYVPQLCQMFDPDCSASCNETATCTLSYSTGFTAKLPPNAWGAAGGFPEYSQSGTVVDLWNSVSGTALKIRSRGRQTKDTGLGSKLDVVSWDMVSMPRRTENCAAVPALGSPGLDCSSPRGSVSVPLIAGIYTSWVYFGEDHMTTTDFNAWESAGQSASPYSPADRVNIVRCSGNPWCDSDHTRFRVESEPESGAIIGLELHLQFCLRIGTRPTLLHPSGFDDATVPVVSMHIYSPESAKVLDKMSQLQGVPGYFNLMLVSSIIGLAIAILCSIGGVIYPIRRARRAAACNEVQVVPGPRSGAAEALPSMLTWTSSGPAKERITPV